MGSEKNEKMKEGKKRKTQVPLTMNIGWFEKSLTTGLESNPGLDGHLLEMASEA